MFAPDVPTGVDLAARAAGDRVVALGGGADVARQCLAAGLVDEIQLHVVPVVLGGPALFGGSVPALTLTKLRVVDAPERHPPARPRRTLSTGPTGRGDTGGDTREADMTVEAPPFNPFDPAFRADPYPFYARLREHEPVHVSPFGFVVLTRYEDVARTLRGAEFSRDIEANAAPTEQDGARAKRREAIRARREAGDAAKSILNLDPPDHTRLRRLVSLAFTPSAIERLRPGVQAMVDGILDRAAERGSMELVDELAFPVPFQVISDLLGMPTERSVELRAWSQALTAALEPTADDDDDGRRRARRRRPVGVPAGDHRRPPPAPRRRPAVAAAGGRGGR